MRTLGIFLALQVSLGRKPHKRHKLQKPHNLHKPDGKCWDKDLWGDTPLNLSWAMCQRTHPNYGDASKMAALVQRLIGKECIQVTTLGNTMGWPEKFVTWLNHTFPCAGSHILLNLGEPGKASDYWEDKISNQWQKDKWFGLWQADLIVVETALEDYGIENPQFHVEGMIRGLLGAPKKPVLVWAACGWRPPSDPIAGHEDALLAHLPLLQYYNVDQVSLINAFLPLHRKSRQDFLAKHLENKPGGGLTELGQQMCAQVLGFALLEQRQDVEQHSAAERQPWFEEDTSVEMVPQRLVMNKQHHYFEEMLEAMVDETDDIEPDDEVERLARDFDPVTEEFPQQSVVSEV